MFRAKGYTAKAFQWVEGVEPPKWFLNAYYEGRAFVVINPNDESYIYTENKRGKYKGFRGDWVVMDEFGHLHIVSKKTFEDRYELECA